MWKKGPIPAAVSNGKQHRQEEQSARNELLAGRDEISIDTTQIPLEHQTVEQLVDTAARTHRDTTAVAERALRVLQESKQIQAETMKQLEDQERTMERIGDKMNEMNEELTYAEKLLSYMRRCCCLWVCDACTGADPEEQRQAKWRRRVERGDTQVDAGALGYSRGGGGGGGGTKGAVNGGGGGGGSSPGAESSSGWEDSGGGGGRRRGDPDIRLPPGHGVTEMRLHQETRKQNDMLDQINAELGQIMEGAKLMKDGLVKQNAELDILDGKAAATRDRLNDVNKSSQLRNMARGKPKTRKEDLLPTLPTKSEAAIAATKRLAGL